MGILASRNLRFRLIALLCISIAPAVALVSHGLIKQYRAADLKVQQETFRLVQTAQNEYSQVIENTRQLLLFLSQTPEVVDQNFAACGAFLARIKSRNPQYTNIIFLNPEGEALCSALPVSYITNFAGQVWFQRAIEAHNVAIGDFQPTVGEKPTIGVAYPVYGSGGKLSMMIYIGLDLAFFEQLALDVGIPEGWELTLRDESGTILTRFPDSGRWLGKQVDEVPIVRPVHGQNIYRVTRTSGLDGVERIYAHSRVPETLDSGGLYLSIGAPSSVAFGKIHKDLLYVLISLGLVVLFGILGMAFGGHFLILSKVNALIRSTRKLCEGDLSVRAGLSHSCDELGQLGAAFDQMAESLELQEIVRKHSQEALQESEQRFRTIFNSVNDPIIVCDLDTGAILNVNKRTCELFGYSHQELLSLEIDALSLHGGFFSAKDGESRLRKAAEGEPQRFEWQARRRDGQNFWAAVTLQIISISNKEYLLFSVRDISGRKAGEIALRESEARYRAFIENSSDGIFRVEFKDPIPVSLPIDEQVSLLIQSAYIAECNEQMAKIHGLSAARKMVGKKLNECSSFSDVHNINTLKFFIQSGYRLVDAEFQKTDGDNGICLLNSLVGVVEDGALVRTWGVQRDITGQKLAEKKLGYISQFNQEIISSARNGIIVYDTELNHVVWNRFMEELTGVPAVDAIGKNAVEIFPQIAENDIYVLIKKALAGESCRSKDVHLVVPQSGKDVWTLWNFGPHYDPEGNIIGVIGIITDIVYRKHAEEELERLSRQKQLILDATGDAIIGLDLQGKITFANPASAEMLGFRTDELVGKDLHNLVHYCKPDGSPYPREECCMYITCQEGTSCRLKDEIFWKKDGTPFPAICSSTPIIESGNTVGAVVTFRDVTEHRKAQDLKIKLEAQLRQAQKMEAIGTLAGGIAHDFNNILTPIMGYCQLALAETDKSSGVYRKIDQVLQSSLRAKQLVKQILAFSRKSEQEKKPVQISLIIKETLNFLRSSLPSTIEIRRQIASGAARCYALADPTQIHQIMMNLSTNAAHAIGESDGFLEVGLSLVEIVSTEDRRQSGLEPGEYLKLSVSDSGCGIEESVRDRIFEPYFTTKGASEGTGLGLAVVYGIVKSLGGGISVSSTLGEGTTFEILLPRADIAEKSTAEIAPSLTAGSGRILLVDDEKTVVEVVKEALEQLGYDVTARYSSLDGFDAFRANPWRFDLVLTDQTMPQMTGLELAKEILKIRSNMPIVLCTGLSETIYKDRALEAGIKVFLMKPLILKDLADAVKKAMYPDLFDE